MKTCTKCKCEKEANEFAKHSKNKDGLQVWCKACKSEESKKPQHKQRQKAYRNENQENIKLKKREYQQANRETESARAKKWQSSNPHSVNEYKKRYAAKNKEKDIDRLKEFIINNPERKDMGRKELRPKYVAYVLTRRETTIKARDIPKELIEVKRTQLQIKRLLKAKK